jgi:alanyl-tRNA synthetase
MKPTERLYYNDSHLLKFSATVLRRGYWNGKPDLVLDRTAFHPEGGGQLGDVGMLDDVRVVDTQVSEDGTIHHLIDDTAAQLPAEGTSLNGEVGKQRRYAQMAVHTGQHLLSAALLDSINAPTLGVRLTEHISSIEVDASTISEATLTQAEDVVNNLIDEDLPVLAFFPTPDELRALPIRRAPKVTENIRVIQVGGFDVTPCGGTHCTRTAQIGLLHIFGSERSKGKTRVFFAAGPQARKELIAATDALAAMGRNFNCPPGGVPAAVEKLKRDLSEARDELARARILVAESVAAELLAGIDEKGDARVVKVIDGATADVLRTIATRLTARSGVSVFLGGRTAEALSVLVARSRDSQLDCGSFVKRVAAATGGRGGGRPELAEGRLPATVDWESVVAAQLEGIAR